MQLYASNVFHYSAIGFSSFAYNVHPSQTFSFISFVERSSRSMDQDPGLISRGPTLGYLNSCLSLALGGPADDGRERVKGEIHFDNFIKI